MLLTPSGKASPDAQEGDSDLRPTLAIPEKLVGRLRLTVEGPQPEGKQRIAKWLMVGANPHTTISHLVYVDTSDQRMLFSQAQRRVFLQGGPDGLSAESLLTCRLTLAPGGKPKD